MTQPIYKTNGLAVGYPKADGGTVLFSDLNLSLHPGNLVCFMGPNGCGKSTLIRTMAGLQRPLQGTLPPVDERSVSIVLTDRINSSHMTVRELVSFGRYPYLGWSLGMNDEDERIINRCIDDVHLSSLSGKTLNELSDGQMQMAMIARALAQDTPLMLLDEPTAHLDLNNRLEIMNLLRRLAHQSGKAILLATHELDLALQTADLVWLASGNTIKTGIPEDLVLDGAFDEVFQFKGYDLKTGKVQHEVVQNRTVELTGEGSVYLWTKNALERNGFDVIAGNNGITITNGGWRFREEIFTTIASLLEHLPR